MFVNENSKGRLIGEGVSRTVYEYKLDPGWVIKQNKNSKKEFAVDHNWLEYQNYLMFRQYNLDSWLSPCLYINGYLLMQRASKINQRISASIPSCFPDKETNWGIYNNRLVCIDYESLKFYRLPHNGKNYFKWQTKAAGYYINRKTWQYLNTLKEHYIFSKDYFKFFIIKDRFMLQKSLQKTRPMRFIRF